MCFAISTNTYKTQNEFRRGCSLDFLTWYGRTPFLSACASKKNTGRLIMTLSTERIELRHGRSPSSSV